MEVTWNVVRLSTLSRPWRHIHRHTPFVDVKLSKWLSASAADVLDKDALAGLEATLASRGRGGSGSKVDTLRITCNIHDARVRRHAEAIVALALPRVDVGSAPAARDLRLAADSYLKPTVTGPGAAALQTLCLDGVVLREWPCLPSLRSLTLFSVTVEAPFPPGAWWPRLESLRILYPVITLARIDIRRPLLKILELKLHAKPGSDITVDAPDLEELDVGCAWVQGYPSFTLRAPRLRCLKWSGLFVERVLIDVGRPGSVTSDWIRFTRSSGIKTKLPPDQVHPEMKDFRAQMTRILEGLLPELPPERVVDTARPYMSLDKSRHATPRCLVLQEKLTCDLTGLMPSLKD